MKHKDHDCINAYWEGAAIEFLGADDEWHFTKNPQWDDCTEYRIGENMKHDLTSNDLSKSRSYCCNGMCSSQHSTCNSN